MQKFEREQKVCRIGDVEIGGQPGERPTVLIGSIFFARHQIVHDAQRGLFDEGQAEALLQSEAEASAFTRNPRFVDPVGDTGAALIRYVEFLAQHNAGDDRVRGGGFSAVRPDALCPVGLPGSRCG